MLPAYSYDAADNLTQLAGAKPLVYDDANELREGPVPPGSSTVTATFGYDADGNRTSATPAGGSATTYDYDQADRLVSFAAPSVERRTYAYDGDGLRVSKTVSSTVERFAWDHGSEGLPLLLKDGTNRYVYGPDGQPLEQIDGSGTVTYLHHDAIGSTRVLTEARGALGATFSYAAYGALTGSTGTQRTPFGFAGEYTDAESGLQYLRARFYDLATAQFLTRDPIASATGQPYAYAGSSPLAFTDPSGLLPDIGKIGMGVSNAAAGALNEVTFGLSNRIAGVDGSCAGAGYGFGSWLGFAGSLITPGAAEKLLARGLFTEEIRRVGREIVRYKTFEPNPLSPYGKEWISRFDRYGDDHYNKVLGRRIETPHVHERYTKGEVRPAEPWEIP